MPDINELASKMRHRIIIQNQVLTPDGIGGNSVSWANFKTVWAHIDSLSGLSGRGLNAEKNFAGRLNEIKPMKITIRYTTGLSTEMRVLFDGRVFNIRSIINLDENNEMLQIYAEEGVSL